jgi:signal peptidase II
MKFELQRRIGWIIVFVVAADWLTKFMILNAVPLYHKVPVLDGLLYFVRLKNEGIAFGILHDVGAIWRTPLLIAAGIFALVLLLRVSRNAASNRVHLGAALVGGGALGNLGDRVVNGGVTDFVMLSFFPYVFNVADTALCTGAVLLALGLGLSSRHEVAQTSTDRVS